MESLPVIEKHPLQPFLPSNVRVLMLGSFPPPLSRWSMDFFYPNFQNDMWRIMSYMAFGDKNGFIRKDGRGFDKEKIERFCNERGIALYDTATEVTRLKNNASDNFLQVEKPTDIAALLGRIPSCSAVVATGQKAAEIISGEMGIEPLQTGVPIKTEFAGREITVWRMPSSSRAYPRSIEWKAEYYKKILCDM